MEYPPLKNFYPCLSNRGSTANEIFYDWAAIFENDFLSWVKIQRMKQISKARICKGVRHVFDTLKIEHYNTTLRNQRHNFTCLEAISDFPIAKEISETIKHFDFFVHWNERFSAGDNILGPQI